MKIFEFSNMEEIYLHQAIGQASITIGAFDAIHTGHQELVRRNNLMAKSTNSLSTVLTFKEHPRKTLDSSKPSHIIYTLKQRLDYLKDLEVQQVVLMTFSKEFSQQTPAEFFEKILINAFAARGIVVGNDFRFGKDRAGDLKLLRTFCQNHSIKLETVDPVLLDEEVISTTRIRTLISEGDFICARKMLGREISMAGLIVEGDKRGQSLGFPTANIKPVNEVRPPRGVYATIMQIGDKHYSSVTNIGYRPTFRGEPDETSLMTIESHILDFDEMIYGEKIILEFLEFIRQEKTFENADGLIEQIKKDIEIARSKLKKS